MNGPTVAIIGRPNVGKSTLFNSLLRRRVSIVEPSSGVTRDRVSALVTESGCQFELVDTGGMGIGDRDVLADAVEAQIRAAIERAEALVLVVDAAEGVLPQDREIADKVRKLGKPVVLVANKAESEQAQATAAEFHQLGLGEPMIISAIHKRGIGELRERLAALVADAATGEALEPDLKIAIVGRRNVGKSTFINAIAKETRAIVSQLAGTTRDSVDVRIERDGRAILAIDTAGLRRKKKVDSGIEFYSQVRAEESVRRADVVLLMLDARQPLSRVDKRLAQYICDQYKPCIIVVNKWDLAKDMATDDYIDYFTRELPGLAIAPICFVSAEQNRHVQSTVDLARVLWKQANTRISTGQLNAVIDKLKEHPLRSKGAARRPKIYYGTQTRTSPPTIILFVNSPKHFDDTIRRYITRFLREELPFKEVPLVVHFKLAGDTRRLAPPQTEPA
jgi:GTPase